MQYLKDAFTLAKFFQKMIFAFYMIIIKYPAAKTFEQLTHIGISSLVFSALENPFKYSLEYDEDCR